jgi:hypothetical protein
VGAEHLAQHWLASRLGAASMSEIRVAREKLLRIADDLEKAGDTRNARRIRWVVKKKMHRKKWVTRSAAHHQSMTPDIAEEVRVHHKLHPSLSQQQLAIHFNVGLGRISEALNGKI